MCMYRFFFNDTATTEIYTLSLHDALPISQGYDGRRCFGRRREDLGPQHQDGIRDCGWVGLRSLVLHPEGVARDRKSTRLNSSHANISYAVFCLKKKNS